MSPQTTAARLLTLLAATLLLALPGCARDVTGGLIREPFPFQITMGMDLEADATLTGADSWYYFVFNFGKVRSTQPQDWPMDIIANEDRGQNWELYVCFHRDQELGVDQVFTAQRSRVPSIRPVANGPADAATGLFNDDDVTDILVASRAGNAIQFIKGVERRVFDNTYFEQAVTVNSGPEPIRVFADGPVTGAVEPTRALDFNGDGVNDALAVFAGTAAGNGFIRPLLSNNNGTFTAGAEVSIPGIPVDAILADFDPPESGTGDFDLAVLTVDSSGVAGTVRLFMGDGAGGFTAGATAAAGADPVQLAAGMLSETGLDLAVAAQGDDAIQVILGDGAGGLSAGPTLATPGTPAGVSINEMFGDEGDVVFSFTGAAENGVGVYLRTLAGFADTPEVVTFNRPAGPIVTFDGDGDTNPDVYMSSSEGAGQGGNVAIIRNGTRRPTISDPLAFFWEEAVVDGADEDPILYPAGNLPERIVIADINADGVTDLIVPNSGTGANGNIIGLYYGLGRHNYTNENIFWTDGLSSESQPRELTLQPWYLSHSFSGTRITLTIDASQFLDLTQMPPELLFEDRMERAYFLVDMMATTHPIDLINKEGQETLGTVTEHFSAPVVVPMELGFLDNEQGNQQRVLPSVTPASQNIINWFVQVD